MPPTAVCARVFAAVIALSAVPAAHAADTPAGTSVPVPLSGTSVQVPLSAETWVATDTAEVEVVAHVTIVDQKPDEARAAVMERIARLVPDARWRITGFDRSTDASGARRWIVRATARIDQAHLDDLGASVNSAAGPGLALRVGRVDTTPSRAEREAALKALRQVIYQRALDERANVKVLWPGRDVEVRRVEFLAPGQVPGPLYARDARAEAAAQAGAPGGMESARRVVLKALVTLAPAAP